MRVTDKAYETQRAAVEAAAEIISKEEAKIAKIERAEDEARSNTEADIKKKAENMRKAREAKEKAEADTTER